MVGHKKTLLLDAEDTGIVDAAETAGPRLDWERRPDESAKAWQAFAAYRDAEPRTFTNVARRLGCSVANISRWAVGTDGTYPSFPPPI